MNNFSIGLIAFTLGAVASAFVFPMLFDLTSDYETATHRVILSDAGTHQPAPTALLSYQAKGISLKDGYEMFQNYHQSSDLPGSAGCMRVNIGDSDSAVVAFFLDKDSLIAPLQERAERDSKDFVGLAVLPAKRTDNDSHTLILMGVIRENGKARLHMPPPGSPSTDFIVEYVSVCPIECPDNTHRLWSTDWQ
ncbi:MAG: hypothetical protein EA392_12285 [Cryomorphaceae bacterium]|nr:MAG: hypothetical protein EA392_12285 [Cryomorphaceae bacterium]